MTAHKLKPQKFTIPKNAKVALVVSSYHNDITYPLRDSATSTLRQNGIAAKNIRIFEAPGAFELAYVAQQVAQKKLADVIITFGCIIKGETPHFDFVALGTTNGIMEVSLKHGIPVVFGVLTTLNLKQAKNRIKGGKSGDKGAECALAALHLLSQKIK